jgi:hypothetical protein
MEPTPGTDRDQAGRRPASVRSRADLWALAELFALTGLVIAQPVLDVTGRSPDVFLFRRADRLDILLLAVGVTVLPALAIWVVEVLVGLVSATLRRHLHLAAMTALFTLLAVEVVKKTTDLRGPRLAVVASAGGLLGGVLYASRSWLRLWLRCLTPAPLVFALLFLLVSPTASLVLPARAGTAPGPTPAVASGGRPPLVIILFDEFPLSSLLDARGRIDRRVYPNIAALADTSTWYRNATGVAGYTPWALPAMLTGNYPAEARAPSFTEYPDNLFTLFGRYYDVRAYETISQLCPPSQCPPSAGNLDQVGLRAVVGDSAEVLGQILQPYDTAFDAAFFVDRTDPQVAAAAQFRWKRIGGNQPSRFNDFLDGLRPSRRPTLHFLHLLLPHQPWHYLPSGTQYNFQTFGRASDGGRTPAPTGRAGPPAAPAPGGLHRPAGRAGGGPAQGRGPVGQGAGRDGGRPRRGMGPRGASAGPRAAQRPRPHVGAAAHQGSRAARRRRRRPQLGAGGPAADHRRPGRGPGALEDGGQLPGRPADPPAPREVVV